MGNWQTDFDDDGNPLMAPNHGKAWSTEDESRMIWMLQRKKEIPEIAKALGRSVVAIEMRIISIYDRAMNLPKAIKYIKEKM